MELAKRVGRMPWQQHLMVETVDLAAAMKREPPDDRLTRGRRVSTVDALDDAVGEVDAGEPCAFVGCVVHRSALACYAAESCFSTRKPQVAISPIAPGRPGMGNHPAALEPEVLVAVAHIDQAAAPAGVVTPQPETITPEQPVPQAHAGAQGNRAIGGELGDNEIAVEISRCLRSVDGHAVAGRDGHEEHPVASEIALTWPANGAAHRAKCGESDGRGERAVTFGHRKWRSVSGVQGDFPLRESDEVAPPSVFTSSRRSTPPLSLLRSATGIGPARSRRRCVGGPRALGEAADVARLAPLPA